MGMGMLAGITQLGGQRQIGSAQNGTQLQQAQRQAATDRPRTNPLAEYQRRIGARPAQRNPTRRYFGQQGVALQREQRRVQTKPFRFSGILQPPPQPVPPRVVTDILRNEHGIGVIDSPTQPPPPGRDR